MAKSGVKVKTGCRDCALCTGNAFTGVGRNMSRGMANIATLGIAAAARKKCGLCDHPMSEHEEWVRQQAASNPPRWVYFNGVYRWFDGTATTNYQAPSEQAPPPLVGQGAQWFRVGADTFQFWTGWDWKAWYADHANAAYPDPSAPASWLPGWYAEGTRYRYWSGATWTDDWSDGERTGRPSSAERVRSRSEPAQASFSAEELMKFVEMHRQGILSDAEFAAVKARLLGT